VAVSMEAVAEGFTAVVAAAFMEEAEEVSTAAACRAEEAFPAAECVADRRAIRREAWARTGEARAGMRRVVTAAECMAAAPMVAMDARTVRTVTGRTVRTTGDPAGHLEATLAATLEAATAPAGRTRATAATRMRGDRIR